MNLFKLWFKKIVEGTEIEFSFLFATKLYNIDKIIEEGLEISRKKNAKLFKIDQIEDERCKEIMLSPRRKGLDISGYEE